MCVLKSSWFLKSRGDGVELICSLDGWGYVSWGLWRLKLICFAFTRPTFFFAPLFHFHCTSVHAVPVQGRTGGKKWPRSYCQTGPLNTRHAAHSVHGALPTQYTARCPFNASHVSTSQCPTWKNTHTLNIILDDYK